MKQLIVLMGASHSGKSNYAEKFKLTHKIISSDSIRNELGVAYGQAEGKVWQDVNGDYRKIAVVFNPPWWKLVGRYIRERRIALSEVRAIYEKWQANKPTESELLMAGFDEVKEVK